MIRAAKKKIKAKKEQKAAELSAKAKAKVAQQFRPEKKIEAGHRDLGRLTSHVLDMREKAVELMRIGI